MMNGTEQPNMEIKIQTFPRIHLTLIGMNNDGYRINGGIGFSISNPKLSLCFKESESVEITDLRTFKFTEFEKEKLISIIKKSIIQYEFKKSISCKIEGDVLPHYGLGSNTSIYLSCLEALFIINNHKYTHNTLILASNRGGTSGVGINTYFEGGFVFDVGIDKQEQILLPSSIAERNGNLPLVLNKCNLPNWQIGICIQNISNKSEQEEIDFFKSCCPIDKSSVEEILYEAVYGITASVLNENYAVFCKAINAIQLTKWKSLERSIYGSELYELENKIKSYGADCVGMSSLGPMLFFMGENLDEIILNINKEFPTAVCYRSYFNNQGRIVSYD